MQIINKITAIVILLGVGHLAMSQSGSTMAKKRPNTIK